MKRTITAVVLALVLAQVNAAAAASAEGSGSNRGTFLSRNSYIINERDIRVEHYIAQYDYDYPLPETEALGASVSTGVLGENAYVQIGLKGRKLPFEAVPPLNVSFCIDRSGSMALVLPWVKDCFYIFIDRVRDGDIVSLVDMDTSARTLIPPTRIQSIEDRTRFKRQVDRIDLGGGTDVYAGMAQGYKELEKMYNPEYVNRQVILTDGMHNFGEKVNRDILDMAAAYNKKGISLSTVMLGITADVGLMSDAALEGGGSSRFISDHDEMVKIFQTELDRMLVASAREVEARLVLADGVVLKNTWGYKHYTEGNTVHYGLPALHNGDYETMFAELGFRSPAGAVQAGVLYLDYQELDNTHRSLGPYPIALNASLTGGGLIADERVRKAEGLLYFARELIDIAKKTQVIADLERSLYQYANPSPQRDDAVQQILVELRQILSITGFVEEYLSGIEASLGGGVYEKELEILGNYTETFTDVYAAYTHRPE
jgi:hypothetical protein